MKCILFMLFSVWGAIALNAQQVDTLSLKKQVSDLYSFESQYDFLKNLYELDQANRGKNTNESLDFEHLILISYYINEFGYPTKRDFDRLSSIPALIWIHIHYRELKKISFPIILQGFLKGEIKESELRYYYLRGLYNYKFDDENFKTIPLSKLFEICELSLESKILIEDIIDIKHKVDSAYSIKKLYETRWKAEGDLGIYELDGEKFQVKKDGEMIGIIHSVDGKFFHYRIHDDNSGEWRELEKVTSNKYKYKHQETDKYFEFLDDRILFRDKLKVIKQYEKCR